MKLLVVGDAPAVVAQALRLLESESRSAIEARGRFAIALAGGSTPKALYRALCDPADRFDWSHVEPFFGDERCVPPDHPDSNFRMASEALAAAPAAVARLHRMPAEGATDAAGDAVARAYGALLESKLGAEPTLDVALLGIGSDGHTASLFPRTPALAVRDRACVYVPEAGLAPFVPRLTLTFPVFERARRLVFLAAGADKAKILREILSGPDLPDDLPAQRLARLRQAIVICDESAAAKLPK